MKLENHACLLRSMKQFFRVILFILIPNFLSAGPPFKTDDPQPVDFSQWEFYLASQQQFFREETNATSPHLEFNYGILPEVQVHIVLPFGYSHSISGTRFGYSDTEIGVKYRFMDETESSPQFGVFPLIEVPTGNENKQLGNGATQLFLPVWIQKSWGKLQTYGGGGFWYNPGIDQKNWEFAGWEVQYDFSSILTLGGELSYQTPDVQNSPSSTGFNVGGYININEHNHILFSAGRNLSGDSVITGYIGYQFTS